MADPKHGTDPRRDQSEAQPAGGAGEGARSRAAEPGSPEGMSSEQVERRSELARFVSGVHAFPADRNTLLARAEDQAAPDWVLAAVRSLPDRKFDNLEEVAEVLGIGGDTQRD